MNNRHGGEVLGAVVVLVGLLGCIMMVGVGGMTVDVDSGRIYNPQAEAQATRVAQLAADEAAAREIERDTTRAAQGGAVLSMLMLYVAGGVGALIVVVGVSFGIVAFVMKVATLVYPNAAGQYPVIVRKGFGYVTYYDPNRGLGPAAVYRTPTVLDTLAGTAWYLRTGMAPALPKIGADFPQAGSEQAMVQVAGQAAAVGLMAAATRPTGLLTVQQVPPRRSDRQDMVEAVMRQIQAQGEGAVGRMPEVRVVDDPVVTARFVNLLEAQND